MSSQDLQLVHGNVNCLTEQGPERTIPGMLPAEPPALRLRGTERRIADALCRLGPATRADVSAATQLSRATVSAGLSALLEAGLVVETSGAAPVGPAGGRPPGLVRLAPRAGLAVG